MNYEIATIVLFDTISLKLTTIRLKKLPFQELRTPNSRNLNNTLKNPNCTSFVSLLSRITHTQMRI
ncbi:hypothetical protein Hanom_Chr08g00701931 [Helianthus anomalus]